MVGGAFLCFEGVEKLAHKLLHASAGGRRRTTRELPRALADPAVDLVALEKDKIKGAIRTDFILSAEIIVITLGTVATAAVRTQVAVLVGIALLMTVGVYGLVAGIVKLDDGGARADAARATALAALSARSAAASCAAAPWLMKGLSVAGTAAMFLVGGGILTHGVPALHHLADEVLHAFDGFARTLGTLLLDGLAGFVAGLLVLAALTLVKRARGAR